MPPSVAGDWHERRESARGGADPLADLPGPGLEIFTGLKRHLEAVGT
jgi:hypothetical protein